MRIFLFLLLSALASISGLPANATDSEGDSFVDTFATFNKKRWFIANGWTNGPHQNCMWSNRNVRLIKGRLELKLNNDASKVRPFSCAEIQTRQLYGYGTYESRIRSVAAPGVVTQFFTYIGPGLGKKYPHDEIDFEFNGKDPNSVELAYWSKGKSHGHRVRLTFDAAASTNDYAIAWLPDSIRWFINGKLVHEKLRGPGVRFPRHPAKIYLGIWTGKGQNMDWWLGKFKYPGHPLVASYEFVAFTKAGTPCQFPESIVCSTAPGEEGTKR